MDITYTGGRDYKHYIPFTGITERRVEFSYKMTWPDGIEQGLRRAIGVVDVKRDLMSILSEVSIPMSIRADVRSSPSFTPGLASRVVTVSFASRPSRQDTDPCSGSALWRSVPMSVSGLGHKVHRAMRFALQGDMRPLHLLQRQRLLAVAT